MSADIKVYDISENGCMVDYKGVTYRVWHDYYLGDTNVYIPPDNKYIGYSLSRVASFVPSTGKQAYESEAFINTFISNLLFEDFKFLGLKRTFDRRGDEICCGETYKIVPNWKGVYYKDGKYIYIRTNESGHVVETLTFTSEKIMMEVLKSKLSKEVISENPFVKQHKAGYHNSIEPEKIVEAGKGIARGGKKIAQTSLIVGAIALSTIAAGAMYLKDRLDK